jgi:hypothetical protein
MYILRNMCRYRLWWGLPQLQRRTGPPSDPAGGNAGEIPGRHRTSPSGPALRRLIFVFPGWLYGRCCDMIQFSTIEISCLRGDVRLLVRSDFALRILNAIRFHHAQIFNGRIAAARALCALA